MRVGMLCNLEFQIAIVDFVPGKSLLVEFFHEGVGVEFFNVPYTWALPKSEHEHAGSNGGRNPRGVAHSLHACFFIGRLV